MKNKITLSLFGLAAFILFPLVSYAGNSIPPSIGSIRIEFVLFALTLVGVAVFYKKSMYVALAGLAVILFVKLFFDGSFSLSEHMLGTNPFVDQIIHKDMRQGEWSIMLNLFGLLIGFGLLATLFKNSGIPDKLPDILPDDWKGGFILLIFVFILSAILDNIASAMIGGAIAFIVFKGKVHIGFLAAIIAASNAGGAGSVIGDTTTTLMWIDGVSPIDVIHAFVASLTAFLIFGFIASKQQDKFQRIQKDASSGVTIDKTILFIVFMILACAILTNWMFDMPFLGVWIALVVGALFRKMPWKEIPGSLEGSVFLMSLVLSASLMPVNELPAASIETAFILGFVSSVFDNIPLTKLCLEQGGYDWGVLAYSVGFGGSMIWFGSSAGVALSNMYPEIKNTTNYLKKGWHVMLAFVVGFFVMIAIVGWNPHAPHKDGEGNKIKKEVKGLKL